MNPIEWLAGLPTWGRVAFIVAVVVFGALWMFWVFACVATADERDRAERERLWVEDCHKARAARESVQ